MDFHKLEIQFSTMSANINTIYIYIYYFILFYFFQLDLLPKELCQTSVSHRYGVLFNSCLQ